MEMNQSLVEPFTTAEVKQPVFCKFPLKSPGPDGIPPLFFQKFWAIVGNDVTCSVLRILNDLALFRKMNHMNVVLIPKCEASETMAQLRPISLCNLEEVRRILGKYEGATRHVIDLQKSSMVIGGCMSDARKSQLASILGVRLVHYHDRYLGLPMTSGRSRRCSLEVMGSSQWIEFEVASTGGQKCVD
ncbi:UNVERIFIED_CONTAM: hypothetical protein Slati_2373400 [Sesamum latifolium]|uniref:Reverse transcriptase n=1 Tax=Sesamum latifolium TaxID=2727402 RepID=A0AAW2WB30_9LAMI